MAYTPPVSDPQAKQGFRKFLKIYLISLIPLTILVIAVIRMQKDYATLSAIFALYSSVFSVITPEKFLNPGNQLVSYENRLDVKKYFTYINYLKAVPIIVSLVLLIMDFFTCTP